MSTHVWAISSCQYYGDLAAVAIATVLTTGKRKAYTELAYNSLLIQLNLIFVFDLQVDVDTMQFGPSHSRWASGSSSMRLARSKEDSGPEISRNKFSALADSGPASIGGYPMQPPSLDSGLRAMNLGGPSRSVGLPSRGSRGPSVESERARALEAVKQTTRPNGRDHAEVGGPAMSLGPLPPGRPAPESLSEASMLLEQVKQLKGKPDMTEDEVAHQAKLLLDEFLHEGNEQVSNCHSSFQFL